MSILMMISADKNGNYPEGSYSDIHWSKTASSKGVMDVVMHETHIGLVLSTGEVNGYDDSDFYAVVWDETKEAAERITYGSTRGWSYPNNASVDATPEIVAAYEAKQKASREAERKHSEEMIAKTPAKGKRARVVKGTKVTVGVEGEIFWMGRDKYERRYANRYASSLRLSDVGIYSIEEKVRGQRVGLVLADGSKVFTSAGNVEVVK